MKICGKTECPLYANGTPMLSPMVMGQNPKVMIVVDCPDAKETKRIFSSEQYRFLQDKIGDSEILAGENSLVLATAVRCHCDQNEYTESHRKKAIKCCREYFLKTIEKYKPKLILSFGGMALNQTTKQSGVKKYQGTLYKSEELDCYVMPMYAPGYILRNQSHEETWNTAFNQVKNFIKRGWSEDCTALTSVSERDFREVQSIKGLFTKEQALDGIAIDTETQGLDWTHPLFTCISYSIAVTQNKSYQIFLFEECPENEKDYSILWERKIGAKKVKQLVHVKRSENFENKVRELRWFLENDDIKKIMHNGNYDCHVFQAFFKVAGRLLKLPQDKRTVQIKGYNFDTQNAAQLYNENVYAMARLEQLQFAFTDIPDRYDTGEFKQAYDKSDMLAVPKDALSLYAEFDTAVTKAASVTLKRYLSENKKLERYMTNMVMPTLETLREMETCGIKVNVPALREAQSGLSAIRDDFHSKALALVPERIKEAHAKAGLSLTRNDFIRDILYSPDGFGIKPEIFTKTKQPSTDQDTLKLIYDKIRSKKAKQFVDFFVDYKKHHTLVTTFLASFDKHKACDGHIHTRYSINQAVTGRTSSSQINLQNIPKRGDAAKIVRRILCAPEGWKVMKADASQAELRWIAHESQDPEMLRIFRTDQDMHLVTAMGMVNHNDPTAWDRLNDAQKAQKRDEAKPVNFGLCLRKGTEVITEKGLKAIEDIVVGDMVLTHKKRFRRVTELQRPKTNELYVIKTKTGRKVECTADHMMLVHFPSANGRPGKQGFVAADELSVGDYLVFHNTILPYAGETTITKTEARIAGWYIAEGSFGNNQFTLSQSREANPDICDLMDVHLASVSFKQCRDAMTYSGNSLTMKTLLEKCGVNYTGKSRGMRFDVNSWINFPVELRCELLAGLWDGDGCIVDMKNRTKMGIVYSSLSMELLDNIRRLLNSLGITSTIYSYPSKRTNMLHVAGSVSMRRFLDLVPTVKIAKSVNYAPKKQFAAEERISSIEVINVANETVYDFTVDEDHSFTADGLFTHNCYGMSVQGLITYAKTDYNIDLSEEIATVYSSAYFGKYKNILSYYDRVMEFHLRNGYVESSLGRRRRIPEIASKNRGMANAAKRQLVNFPIQSPSSDTVLLVANELRKMKLPKNDIKLSMFIHDELIMLVREDCDIDKYARLFKGLMEHPPIDKLFGVKFSVPMKTDVKIGDNINDCKELKL